MIETQEKELKRLTGQIAELDGELASLDERVHARLAEYKARGINVLQDKEATAAMTGLYEERDRTAERVAGLRSDRESLMYQISPRNGDGGGYVDADTVSLTGSQRMADWSRSRGLAGVDQELNFGKYIRGMVTGDWDGAQPEFMALSGGTLAEGGYLVPTPLSSEIIDLARDQARVVQAGALSVPMTSQTLGIARIASDPQAEWHAENALIGNTDMTFERVEFQARTLVALVKASREVIADAANMETVMTAAFSSALALELDRVALYGTGVAPEPRGVKNTTGVQVQDLGVNGAQIAIPGDYLDSLELLWNANHEPTGIIQAPRTEIAIAREADTTGQPKRLPDVLARIPRFQTKQVPVNLTQGTAGNASDSFMARWSELLIGVRADLQIDVLKERYADNYQLGFLASMRADIQLARPAAFVVTQGIIP